MDIVSVCQDKPCLEVCITAVMDDSKTNSAQQTASKTYHKTGRQNKTY